MSDSYKKIGEVLAAARREQKRELADIAESTKIMVKYLEAVESGSPEVLPSNAYFTLFARSYAQNLGLDPNVIDELQDTDLSGAVDDTDDAKASVDVRESESKRQARRFARTIIILIVAASVIFAAFVIYMKFYAGSDETSPQHQAVAAIDEPTAAMVADDAGVQSLPDMDITPYDKPASLKLDLRVKQDVWALVVSDGDTVCNRELKAGDRRSWEADYRYYLTLGISTAVDMTMNGEPMAPLSDRARTISNLEINQVNYRQFLLGETTAAARVAEPPVTPPPSVVVKPRPDISQPPSAPDSAADSISGVAPDGN